MRGRYAFGAVVALAAALGSLALWLARGHLTLLAPAGAIAAREEALIGVALELMLLVVVPVFILTGVIAWHYRATNTRARYLPDWEHNAIEEAVWWFVPLVIIAVLAVITWRSTHALDPYKPLAPAPMRVEVVSLDWKWLFIYPAEGIATVNYLALPVGVPVDFSLTSDAPMNAFFIPALGGQMMTMPGMVTHLNLVADEAGTYLGLSSSYSGAGFAGMQFAVHALPPEAYARWVASVAAATTTLDRASYAALAAPSTDAPAAFYRLGDPGLYTDIVMRYMTPQTDTSQASSTTSQTSPAAMSGM